MTPARLSSACSAPQASPGKWWLRPPAAAGGSCSPGSARSTACMIGPCDPGDAALRLPPPRPGVLRRFLDELDGQVRAARLRDLHALRQHGQEGAEAPGSVVVLVEGRVERQHLALQ